MLISAALHKIEKKNYQRSHKNFTTMVLFNNRFFIFLSRKHEKFENTKSIVNVRLFRAFEPLCFRDSYLFINFN